ncbi:MAG: QueT transporter family protein [Thermoprotei archaeon]
MKSNEIALTSIITALYVGLIEIFHPISFEVIQVRVANALLGVVPVFGWPAIVGVTLGVFIGNITSPLGPIDLLSAIPTFIGCYIIYKLKSTSVLLGLTTYTLILSLWVGYILWYVLGLPYIITVAYLFIGIGISTIFLGYIVYKALRRVIK